MAKRTGANALIAKVKGMRLCQNVAQDHHQILCLMPRSLNIKFPSFEKIYYSLRSSLSVTLRENTQIKELLNSMEF